MSRRYWCRLGRATDFVTHRAQATTFLSNTVSRVIIEGVGGKYTLAIFCDMVIAFEYLDISILLDKLNYYVIRGRTNLDR